MAKIKKEKEPTALDLYEICLGLNSTESVALMGGWYAPMSGLCGLLDKTQYLKTLKKFTPTVDDAERLSWEGKCLSHWGSGLDRGDIGRARYEFTPLRQTILLLIAAMHDEL